MTGWLSWLFRRCNAGLQAVVQWALQPRVFWLFLGAWLVVTIVKNYLAETNFETEAIYWEFARRPALGYFSKPPLSAYIIWATTALLGHAEWAVRLGGNLLVAGSGALAYITARRLAAHPIAGAIAGYLFLLSPYRIAGAQYMNPDKALMFFWIASIYVFWRAVNEERRFWWILLGVTLGFGFMSKYTMGLLVLSFLLYALCYARHSFVTPGPYVSCIIALGVNSGVIYWNIQHDFISLTHTASLVSVDLTTQQDLWQLCAALLRRFGEFLLANIRSLIIYPWIIYMLLRKRVPAYRLLLLCFAGTFVPFFFISFAEGSLFHWFDPAYWALVIATGIVVWQHGAPRLVRTILVLLVLFGMVVLFWPLPRHTQGRALGKALAEVHEAHPAAREAFVFSDTDWLLPYVLAGFYGPGQPEVYEFSRGHILTPYGIWGDWSELVGRDALYVQMGNFHGTREAAETFVTEGYFRDTTPLHEIEAQPEDGRPYSMSIHLMQGYTGKPVAPVTI
ncbi:MAG: glycosyltransferase family 39 protein [Candidatus Hydrogenedentota bacterium]